MAARKKMDFSLTSKTAQLLLVAVTLVIAVRCTTGSGQELSAAVSMPTVSTGLRFENGKTRNFK